MSALRVGLLLEPSSEGKEAFNVKRGESSRKHIETDPLAEVALAGVSQLGPLSSRQGIEDSGAIVEAFQPSEEFLAFRKENQTALLAAQDEVSREEPPGESSPPRKPDREKRLRRLSDGKACLSVGEASSPSQRRALKGRLLKTSRKRRQPIVSASESDQETAGLQQSAKRPFASKFQKAKKRRVADSSSTSSSDSASDEEVVS